MAVTKELDKDTIKADAAHTKLVPFYNEFYGAALDLIKFPQQESIKVLELGASNSFFTYRLFERFPNAEFVLYDLSETKLAVAKQRLLNKTKEIKFVNKDFAIEPINGNYDVVISTLTVHRLSDTDKQALFKNIFNSLNNNGVFINADQVLGESDSIESVYQSEWLEQVTQQGASQSDLQQAQERRQASSLSTLSEQLNWLKSASFSDVNCWYKNYRFVVYSGIKT